MSRQPRFEVVHTGPRQFHARFRAANGQVVFVTESYRRRRAAVRAIQQIGDLVLVWAEDAPEVREVDER